MDHDLGALATVPLFARLDRDQLHQLVGRSLVRTVTAGVVVARHGQPADRLIVVETGVLGATYDTANGQRLRLGEFTAPCAVDKTAVLNGCGYTATWTAVTRARIRLVAATELFALLDDVPAARHHVLAQLARQLRDQQDDLVRAHFTDATTRTAA